MVFAIHLHESAMGLFSPCCRSPTPVTRDSTWRDERCRWERWKMSAREMRQPLNLLWTAYYSKFKILFYTFTKTLGQRFDIFSSPSPRFIISINHCCSSNSSCFSDSLGISLIIYYLPLVMCPIVNLWLHCNSCYIPHFSSVAVSNSLWPHGLKHASFPSPSPTLR